MKKSTSSYSSTTPKKQTVSKPLSTGRVLSKVGPGGAGPSAAAVNRRSPVVLTDQTIATNSVIQAATDPKIKELVMKQQQEESRRESSKRPRADGFTATHHGLDHPNSAPHHSHHGQQFWKHNSFEGTESLNMSLNASLNDTAPESEKSFSKYSTVSPDAHQQQKHYQFMEQAGGATPGSAMETVVVHGDGAGAGGARAHHDDDGVNSEITVDAGYMMMHKVDTGAHSQGQGISPNTNPGPLSGSAGQGMGQGQQGAHMNMYMDMNSSLLHEHHNHANTSGTAVKSLQSSPVTASMAQNHHANLPVPPPLNLPVAAPPPLGGSMAQTPTGHISTISTAPTAQAQEPVVLPDPRALSDQALQAVYVQFLLEMETRGLQSMNLNVASLMAASQGGAANFSSSSSCMGAPTAHAVVPTSAPSPTLASAAGGAHYSAEVDMINRTAAQRAPVQVQAHGSAKPAPTIAHMALAAGVAGANPADIRKNVKRSKSNGSEAAFYPSAMFPGAQPNAPAPVPTGSSGAPSGRKTPNSPMLGRYTHASEGGAISYAQYLQQFGEPEEFELKDAFGQARHPGSPSYHSPYSPSHLSSNAPAPSYYQMHGHLHTVPQPAHGHAGATPTSVTAGSANWANAPGAHAIPAVPVAAAVPQNPNLSRSASRCSGVQPPLVVESRDELELRPGLRTNCLSTLPPTYSQYMYAHNSTSGASAQQAAGTAQANAQSSDEVSTASAEPRRVDLKTPKFVRKFQGIGAGLLGLTAALRFSSAEEEAEYTASTAAAASRGRAAASASGSSARSGTRAAPQTVHTSAPASSSRTDAAADNDNTVDAVREAGGLDNLLLPGRAQHLRSGLQPDEHSTFSQGSMSAFSQPSLNSTRSNSKKSSKTRS